jgi:glycosyltransferase involved in cell wall biosynthesis
MPTGIGYLRDFSYVLLFKLAGVTPIFHLHNQGIYEKSKNRIFLKMYKFTFSNSSVIHLSEGLLKKEIISLKASNCYTYVVKNGIPIRDRTLPRKNFDISGNVIPVLFLSHILPLKGLETLIETMRLLNASELYPPLKLYLAGAFYSKHYKRKILKRIESQKLMPQIEILGELNENDKQEYFRKCKYFVFPSFSDTLGLVVLEAMQAGLACIVTNSGALPEYFEENKDCFFVNPGNASALAKALSNLVSSPQLASEIAESGRRKVMYYSQKKFESDIQVCFNSIFKI